MATELALSTADFESKVLQSEVPVLIDFWAEWCGPCRAIAPFVEQIASEYNGRAKVFKVDVDNEPELAGRFGVMSIPTLLVFKDGQRVGQLIGAVPKQKIAELIDRHL
ncbi:MAG: thioredoxin [Fimbriimonadaceae bacterium]|uniref:Thioredoxin n=1 Tax=Candidatus Nitrosymbiomonas proteolyticus TaxID=2608984 RepID=A0A809SBE2_9BACT|nr:MAG: thioredoxin [Armatimonadota bacterium]KXK22466.1 MAG: thioredoxin [Armatimonadetes bacterium OLB18]MBV6491514.1 Thioredoxin 1 [Fimbriimonadaceae bacterium]QOJ13007.1 MAG: thioredoxin [Chthonomonadaceae bacterium]BBO24901.1 thioredoxin [Candidatus Nitrosymbiomonas proteolyticus]